MRKIQLNISNKFSKILLYNSKSSQNCNKLLSFKRSKKRLNKNLRNKRKSEVTRSIEDKERVNKNFHRMQLVIKLMSLLKIFIT